MRKGDFLKDRAERFFKNALELFNREEYDLSAFDLEQASQLFLKYAIWKKLGDFEKTYEISKLLMDFKEVSSFSRRIEEFMKSHEEAISDLEMAYIKSRYLPVQFYKTQVEKMIKFVEELKEILEKE